LKEDSRFPGFRFVIDRAYVITVQCWARIELELSMARKRRSESIVDVLMQLPWQVSFVLAFAVYLGFKYALPALWSFNPVLKAMAAGLSGIAWVFTGALLLVGVFAFVAQKMAAAKAVGATNQPTFDREPHCDTAELTQHREPIGTVWANSISNSSAKRSDLVAPLAEATARIEPSLHELGKIRTWSLELIRDIEWKRFETFARSFTSPREYAVKRPHWDLTAASTSGCSKTIQEKQQPLSNASLGASDLLASSQCANCWA
jgi:hypothetical protein